MKAVAVIDKNRALGFKGELLYRIPGDLKHFKKETLGKTIIIGRKTLNSLPAGRPLKGRHTVVISRAMAPGLFYSEGGWDAVVLPSKEAALELLSFGGFTEPVVCGGEQVYRLFFHECDELVLTEVDAEKKADAYFPEFSGEFEEYENGTKITENGISYCVNRYRRRKG